MFCIYSFDFIKKNTDPQLSKFTPSKFLSNCGVGIEETHHHACWI